MVLANGSIQKFIIAKRYKSLPANLAKAVESYGRFGTFAPLGSFSDEKLQNTTSVHLPQKQAKIILEKRGTPN